ncbi:MAG: 2-iminoacetate synthase ThiH [Dictyoglomaceae bacterium]
MIEEVLKEADKILKERNQKTSIENVLFKEKIFPYELLTLLLDDNDENLYLMAEVSKKITERYFGKVINLFTPLYLSNYCTCGCSYCGFSMENRNLKRIKLNEEEILKELKTIKSFGIDSILLLTGCDMINTPFEYILSGVKIAKDMFSEVAVEVYPLKEEEYKILVQNGLTGVTQYQETYNKEVYDKLHPYGPKRDYYYRLYTQERALKGGVKEVTLGVLLGLNDPIEDVFKMILHAEYLMKKFPNAEINVSFPRFRPAGTNFKESFKITDKMMLRFIFSARIYLKNVGIPLSTRENSKFRDALIGYGITKMSAGSKTCVGGYSKEYYSGNQFENEDKRSVEEIVEVIKRKGYRPEFTNWVKGVVA